MRWWRAVAAGCLISMGLWAQQQPADDTDARTVRMQLSNLVRRYPPSLGNVLGADPALLGNREYLSAYPGLVNFLNSHPEIVKAPSYYVGDFVRQTEPYRPSEAREAFQGISVFLAFGMAISLVVWLIRTVIDYRRWNKLTKVQTDVHTRILDRFSANEELLAYIQSPAGSKFLQSAPISLDAGPRSVAAPMGRILWSVQAGVVLTAVGFALLVVSGRFSGQGGNPFQLLGAVGIALGIGFILSAGASFAISRKLGLIEPPRAE